MNKPDYKNMTDKDFADFLKGYAAERKGDLADIINEAAARVYAKILLNNLACDVMKKAKAEMKAMEEECKADRAAMEKAREEVLRIRDEIMGEIE